MKKFVTEDSFWQLFPGASLGVIVARGMKPANEISPEDAQAIEQLLIRANALAEKHLESPTLSENAPVRAWRQAYQQFKTKRGARCSIENLLKRVLKGNPVGSISPSVDLYSAISLKYALPLGGEDLDAFEGGPAPSHHRGRRRIHAAWRGCRERPHAARRARLCR